MGCSRALRSRSTRTTGSPSASAQPAGDVRAGSHRLEAQHRGGRLLPGVREVVVEAGQLQGPAHLGLHDPGADAAPADDQPLVHELLHGPSHRRPGDAQLLGEHDLVVEQGALGEGAGGDRLLEVLGDLEPQRDRARPVDGQRRERVVGGPEGADMGASMSYDLMLGQSIDSAVRTFDWIGVVTTSLPVDRIAGAPISWGLCEVPGWGYQLTPQRVLSEMQGLGLVATEFGPPGFLEAEAELARGPAGVLRPRCRRRLPRGGPARPRPRPAPRRRRVHRRVPGRQGRHGRPRGRHRPGRVRRPARARRGGLADPARQPGPDRRPRRRAAASRPPCTRTWAP